MVSREIAQSPEKVRDYFSRVAEILEVYDVNDDALRLQEAYLKVGVVTPKWSDDALHVALATVSGCSTIVSWNFKHIVHVQKVPLYNAVNALNGYAQLAIVSPSEVIQYDD